MGRACRRGRSPQGLDALTQVVAGIEKGERDLLLRQLTARFGPVPQEFKTRLDDATSEEIERWALSFGVARTLEELFGPE